MLNTNPYFGCPILDTLSFLRLEFMQSAYIRWLLS